MLRDVHATPVVAADMTQLLSADSYFKKSESLGRWISRPADPGARRSFEAVCDAITNDWSLTFRAPENPPSSDGRPLYAMWKDLARPSEGSSVPSESIEATCNAMCSAFCSFLEEPGAVERLVGFARFQFSDPQLMHIFWMNNDESRLSTAFESLRESNALSSQALPNALLQLDDREIDPVSIRRLTSGRWSFEHFAIAYLFWAFAKGYRYAASLQSDETYMTHWLRDGAVDRDPAATQTGHKELPRCRWGRILSGAVLHPELAFDQGKLERVLIELRNYTARNWSTAVGHESEFLENGLAECSQVAAVDYQHLRVAAAAGIGLNIASTIPALLLGELLWLPAVAMLFGYTSPQIDNKINSFRLWRIHKRIAREIVELSNDDGP